MIDQKYTSKKRTIENIYQIDLQTSVIWNLDFCLRLPQIVVVKSRGWQKVISKPVNFTP